MAIVAVVALAGTRYALRRSAGPKPLGVAWGTMLPEAAVRTSAVHAASPGIVDASHARRANPEPTANTALPAMARCVAAAPSLASGSALQLQVAAAATMQGTIANDACVGDCRTTSSRP